MAEIKDVYSLEFNSGQFQSEIDSAIARIEELNSAMADGADVADELASAQGSLVTVLGTEAKGVEQLNQKRNVLVNTQKQVNNESKAGVAVGKQLDTTNKQIAVSTGQAATQQRGFVGNLLSGTRAIGQMRRVTSTLTFAFKALSAAIPFGIILQFIGPIIDFFKNLVSGSDDTAENMEKLSDTTLSLSERLKIAETELEKLNAIESNRGKLTDEEQKRRRELLKVYEDTSNEIVKIEQDRADRIREIEFALAGARIELLGDTAQGVIESAELQKQKLFNEISKRVAESEKTRIEIQKEIEQAQAEFALTSSSDASIRISRLNALLQKTWEAELKIFEEQDLRKLAIEKQKNEKLEQIRKQAQDKARKDALDAANKDIEDQTNRLKLEILRTEEGSQDRLEAEAKLIDEILALKQKYAKELQLDDEELRIMQLEGLDEREKLFDKYYESLKEKKDKNKDVIIGPTREDLIQKMKELNDALKAESDIYENNNEANLANQLVKLETERNNDLLFAAQTIKDQEKLATKFESIDEKYNEKRKDLEKKANIEILKQRITLLESLKLAAMATGDTAAEAELNKQIAQTKLQLAELQKINTDYAKQNADAAKDAKKKKEEDDKDSIRQTKRTY